MQVHLTHDISNTDILKYRLVTKKYSLVSFPVFIITPGPGCSKLTTSSINVSLKFQTLISEIQQYFCSAKASLFFQQKISVYLVIKSLNT